MVSNPPLVQMRAGRRTRRRPMPVAPGAFDSAGVIIPYDHAATFELTGRPGNVVQGVINVSSDGAFVATAIGYGFEQQRARPINGTSTFTTAAPVVPGDVTLAQVPLAALIEGFRISPRFAPLVFAANQTFL